MMVLSSALESLPENMRQILNLAGMENLSYEQIADILDVPLGTVRSLCHGPARRGSAWKRKGPCCPSEAVAGPRPRNPIITRRYTRARSNPGRTSPAMRRRAAWMAARRDGAAVPQRVQQLWILRLGHRDGQWRGTAGGRGGP